MNEKEVLLQKLKALAERGEGGEKKNAAALLEKLMNKYGISEEDLKAERERDYFFPYHQETERRLLIQIIYAVTGKAASGTVGTYTNRKRKKMSVSCTVAEKLEIEAYYSFYGEAMRKELETFYHAFAMKNNLFPSPEKIKDRERDEYTEEEIERAMKAAQMAGGMDVHTFRKQIEAGA